MNTCETCKWSFLTWAQTSPAQMPTHHLRCWPNGDSEGEQVADIPCLKWRLDDGGMAA